MLCYGVLPTDARLAVVSRFQHLFMGRPQRSAVHTVEQVTSLFAPSLRKQLSARRSALSPDVVAMLCQGALLLVGILTDQLCAFGQLGSALASSLCEQFQAVLAASLAVACRFTLSPCFATCYGRDRCWRNHRSRRESCFTNRFTIALPSCYRAFLAHLLTSAADAQAPRAVAQGTRSFAVTTPTTASVSGGGFALPFALPTNL